MIRLPAQGPRGSVPGPAVGSPQVPGWTAPSRRHRDLLHLGQGHHQFKALSFRGPGSGSSLPSTFVNPETRTQSWRCARAMLGLRDTALHVQQHLCEPKPHSRVGSPSPDEVSRGTGDPLGPTTPWKDIMSRSHTRSSSKHLTRFNSFNPTTLQCRHHPSFYR